MIGKCLTFPDLAKGMSERSRRIAFYAAIIGLLMNNALFINYLWMGAFGPDLIINNLFYNLICLTIGVSSYTNYHFKLAYKTGLSVIVLHIWLNTLIPAVNGSASIMDLPVLLFAPMILVTFAGHRTLAMVACVQAGLLYVYLWHIGGRTFAQNWPPELLQGFTLSLVTMSCLTILALAAIAYAREHTDRRLFDLIHEKEQLAAEDSLTGLHNRRSFQLILEQNIAETIKLGCAFIDLDRFKSINDEYGHAIGDKVIQTIGERLARAPSVLCVARLGGDEFGLLVATEPLSMSMHAAFETLQKQLCQDIMTEAGSVGVGASIGYAVYPEDGQDPQELMHAADIAMRRTKAEKMGAIRFNKTLDNTRLTRATLEKNFKNALTHRDLRPALQPIICSRSGDIVGHEIFSRWLNSTLAPPPAPQDFIPIAERFGLLNELLISTLDQALSGRDPAAKSFLALNISPSQLSQPNFLSNLSALLAAHQVDPARIELEITEQVAFRNAEHNIETLSQARAMGMKIALDDFGTGYSSLSILDTLPLDKLKIDSAFVKRPGLNAERHSLLAATLAMARHLNLTTCLEGVEDADTARLASDLGCDLLQGYWIGQPELLDDTHCCDTNPVKRIA